MDTICFVKLSLVSRAGIVVESVSICGASSLRPRLTRPQGHEQRDDASLDLSGNGKDRDVMPFV